MSTILYLIIGFFAVKLALSILAKDQAEYIYVGPFDFFIPVAETNGRIQKLLKEIDISPVIVPPGLKVSAYGVSVTIPLKKEYTSEMVNAIAKGVKFAVETGLYKTRVEKVPGGALIHIPRIKIKV